MFKVGSFKLDIYVVGMAMVTQYRVALEICGPGWASAQTSNSSAGSFEERDKTKFLRNSSLAHFHHASKWFL